MTGSYPTAEYLEDLLRVTAGTTDPALARITVERSQELQDWLAGAGIRFQPSLGGTLSLGRTNAFFLGGGRAMLNGLYREAERLGVRVSYDSEVVALEMTNGAFAAATVRSPGGERRMSARALVAAAGGFEANLEWLEREWGPAARNFLIRGTPYNRGGVLRLLMDAGAATAGDPRQCHAVAIDGRAPRFDGGIVTRLDCVPFGIVVNQDARRFYDEGEDIWPKRYAIWGRLVALQAGQIGTVLIDAKSFDLFMPSVFPPVRADTIAGIAAALGLDPATLADTVARFNAACRGGRFDHTGYDDCRTEGLEPPKTHWARPLDTPPFYAYPLRPGITFTYLGVKVDAQAGVVMNSGNRAPNVFAAGEIMAGNVLGKGYLAGIGMTIGAVFGRIAGEEAARVARH
jgi:tricarballylate dehydrogenase